MARIRFFLIFALIIGTHSAIAQNTNQPSDFSPAEQQTFARLLDDAYADLSMGDVIGQSTQVSDSVQVLAGSISDNARDRINRLYAIAVSHNLPLPDTMSIRASRDLDWLKTLPAQDQGNGYLAYTARDLMGDIDFYQKIVILGRNRSMIEMARISLTEARKHLRIVDQVAEFPTGSLYPGPH